MDSDPDFHALSSDAPVQAAADDSFGRSRIASRIAAEARLAPPGAGFVIALCGPWGSGKTSIANLAIEHLATDSKVAIVRFNPWMFSGEADLVNLFFGELATTLGKEEGNLRGIASKAAEYAGTLSGLAQLIPGVGTAVSATISSGEQLLKAATETPSLAQRRCDLTDALAEYDGRIVVFLDDLDRVTDDEIQQVVKLVKLVGDLPRITYVLAFDRSRVEQALGEPESDPDKARERGRNYLEKIVQSRHDVPSLRPQTIIRFLQQQMAEAIEPYGERYLHHDDWANMLGLALRYMIQTPRDAKRIANALPAAVELYGDEVALVDLIGLEVLRVVEPDVHTTLSQVADILVDDRFVFGDEERRRKEDQERIEALLSVAHRPEPTKALLRQLFPRAQRSLGDVRGEKTERAERLEKRVAVPSVFRAYLHATLDDDALAATEVERLAGLLTDPDGLAQAFAAIEDRFLADAISRLIDYKDRFNPEHAQHVAQVLVELEPRLPPDESPIFTRRIPSSWELRNLVGLVLLSETDLQRRAALVKQLVADAPSLSSRHRVLTWFGTFPEQRRRDPDAEMLDESMTRQFMDELRDAVARTPGDELSRERSVTSLLPGLAEPDPDAGRAAIKDKLGDDALMLAVLTGSYGMQKAQTIGEAAVRRSPQIAWRRLIDLTDEDWLVERVLRLAATVSSCDLEETAVEALDFAARVARGEVHPEPDL